MADRIATRARMTGFVYLLYFLVAIVAQLSASKKLFAYGDALNLISYGLYIVLTLLFYFLFKPVNRTISLIAAISSLAGCTIGVLHLTHSGLTRINPLLFFGCYCLLLGYLILKSTFLPHFLGWLMILAGVGWLIFLFPHLARHLSLLVEILGIFAEAALMLWLVMVGVNVERWREQASPEPPISATSASPSA
jgi:hypothetical protein